LYVDEAHSIGAIGATGRGVCEQTGVEPDDVDILMGTFTKAFGSVGGYVAGSKEFIAYLKNKSFGTIYSTAMSPPCAKQALSALKQILGEDGTKDGINRVIQLHRNTNFFKFRMEQEGFHMYGDVNSPVVLMMAYTPSILAHISRGCLEDGIALVIVGFPVTPLLLTRIRFCISASHTIEELETAIAKISKLGGEVNAKYAKNAGYWTYVEKIGKKFDFTPYTPLK